MLARGAFTVRMYACGYETPTGSRKCAETFGSLAVYLFGVFYWLRNAHSFRSQLLDVPAVANLRSSEETEDVRHFNLLHLFSYVFVFFSVFLVFGAHNFAIGRYESYSQYASNPRLYGELSHEQERKLRQLSIVSMGARHSRIEYGASVQRSF